MLTGSSYRSITRQHRLVVFFVLAYVFSWWAWIPYALGGFSNPIASFGLAH